jgi:hypothetical protein
MGGVGDIGREGRQCELLRGLTGRFAHRLALCLAATILLAVPCTARRRLNASASCTCESWLTPAGLVRCTPAPNSGTRSIGDAIQTIASFAGEERRVVASGWFVAAF